MRLRLESAQQRNGHRPRTYAQITGWGRYLPANVVTNCELSRTVDTNDEWIRERTGIAERRVAPPKEFTSNMALKAARDALAVAGLNAKKLDAVIVATSSPDQLVPATASVLQNALGATHAAACDVNAGCSGFIYTLVMANALIAAGTYQNILVVGADTLTRLTDWGDRSTCVLFGDGAGAVVLQSTDIPTGILGSTLGSDGFGADLLYVAAGGARLPASHETVDKRMHFINMNGREVFKFAVTKMVKATQQVVAAAGLGLEDIDLFIPHQANLRIIQSAAKALKLPDERFFVNIDRFGNTSSASIPIAITEAVETGRIKQGDNLVLVGFGAGLTWGAMLVQWGVPPIRAKRGPMRSIARKLQSGRWQIRRASRLAMRRLDPRRWQE